MLTAQRNYLTEQLNRVVESLGYESTSPEWRNVPFLGSWGLATSVAYRLAAQELEGVDLDKRTRSHIARERAPEIAEEIAKALQSVEIAGRVEAQEGYVNFYFDVPALTSRLVKSVLHEGRDYGRGTAKLERIMVEYSQPNTHKAFHVGHLRNVCLGHSLALILDFAGFDTITANYIGDIGMHVIKCLWCYTRFHEGQEPAKGRGKWLGQVYSEADRRLELRDHVVGLIHDLIRLPSLLVRLHNWVDQHLESPVKSQLLHKLDPGWQGVIEEIESGLENLAQEEGSSVLVASSMESMAQGKKSGVVVDRGDNDSFTIAVGGPGASWYCQVLETLLSGRSLEASMHVLQHIGDQDAVAGAVRQHVPTLWPEIGRWIQEAVSPSGSSGDSHASDTGQWQTLSELLGLYETLDNRMEWWPNVDRWHAETKELFLRWDAKDPEVVSLWEKTKEWSMEEFREIYDFLGAEFEVWFYESQVEEEGKEIVDDMIEKGIAEDLRPDGPVLVHVDRLLGLEKGDRRGEVTGGEYRTLLVLRSDGTSLYSTKDLALAKRKFEDYGVDRSIYVVDVRQAFYFRQVFKVLELWGFEQAKNCYHLAYEIVTDPAGTMSSRAGNVVPFEDFVEMAVSRALAVVEAKNPDLQDAQKKGIARGVALGAMKYSMISVDDNKVITFDLEDALSLEGRSAPYIQYAHARACRVLEKAGGISELEPDYSHLVVPTTSQPKAELLAEINLIEKVAEFPQVVLRAATRYKPHLISTYVFELASLFTDFYQNCDVLRGDVPDGVRAARLRLVRAARQTLANGLALLGIEAPEVM